MKGRKNVSVCCLVIRCSLLLELFAKFKSMPVQVHWTDATATVSEFPFVCFAQQTQDALLRQEKINALEL